LSQLGIIEATPELIYLSGYPEHIVSAVQKRIASGTLKDYLLAQYPKQNELKSDKMLFEFVQNLKTEFLRRDPPISKIHYDNKMRDLRGALGTHTRVNKVHGRQVKCKNEIRIASVFKNGPAEFLNMICAHELAHLREKDHNKAFYNLCIHMEPNYVMLELDTRIYLTFLDLKLGVLYAV
jgi:UTP pyrophosphatase